MALSEMNYVEGGGGMSIEDIADLITSNMQSGNTTAGTFPATVGKKYLLVYMRNTSYPNPGVESGANVIHQVVLKDTVHSQNIYIGFIQATSTTVKGIGTGNPKYYCQLD